MAIDDITINAGECEEGKVINNIFSENERRNCLIDYNLPQPYTHFSRKDIFH